ncbi:hypothetical protein FALBO_7432 [Fusarium albosuccineum]|uniref:Uncharacterized protein n=1 Tax=Fusarium albosuccineum TaxID=1237068 RepID=A0A8H4LDJ4_9HYPO|nr:hypothetical protein FALBO_7432 [Fusarium albosuccineum]
MLLQQFLSVVALAATAYAGPCKPPTTTDSTSVTASTTVTSVAENTSTDLTTTTSDSESATTADLTTTVSTTTTTEAATGPTFSIVAANDAGGHNGYYLSNEKGAPENYHVQFKLRRASDLTATYNSRFHIDATTGHLISTDGNSVCAYLFNTEAVAEVDPSPLYSCTHPRPGEVAYVVCELFSSGLLRCAAPSPFGDTGERQYPYVDNDNIVKLGSTSSGFDGFTSFDLQAELVN